MALTYGFYNSLKGDRRYNAEQVSEIFDGILIDGIIPSIGQLFVVKTANNRMQITVGTGRAWFDHTWTKNDSMMLLVVPASDVTRPRYDAVVLEVNHNTRINSIKIVKGSADVNPLKPTLANEEKVHQYPLAYILVRAGTSEIKAADIENTVGISPTPFAKGVLETAPLDDLWNQWKGEFTDWFDNIKSQLSGNIATNLQNQIDAVRNSIPVKATDNETLTGSNNTKFVTPSGLKKTIEANRRYLTDNNGMTYTWKPRDVLPMLNSPGDTSIDEDSMQKGYVVHLANYEVLHYLDKIFVFDKAGSVRQYSVSVNLDHPWTTTYDGGTSHIGMVFETTYTTSYIMTNRAMPIRGTNSYFAFTDTSLYKITIGSGSPTVSLYYTWPSTDGKPVALSYINSEWSGLVLMLSGVHSFRVFKISNTYVSQPTIYTFDLSSYSGFTSTTNINRKLHGIAGRYAIYSSNNYYAIADILTGSLVKSSGSFPTDALTKVIYCFVDDVHGMFNVFTQTICYSFSSTSTSYTTNSLTMSGATNSVITSPAKHVVDVENGVCYFPFVADTLGYIIRCKYTGTFQASHYTLPSYVDMTTLATINGCSKFYTFEWGYIRRVSSSTTIIGHLVTYSIILANMIGGLTYFEKYPCYAPIQGDSYMYPSDAAMLLPVPKLMIYERFVYCYSKFKSIGMAKFDLQARTFVGVPI